MYFQGTNNPVGWGKVHGIAETWTQLSNPFKATWIIFWFILIYFLLEAFIDYIYSFHSVYHLIRNNSRIFETWRLSESYLKEGGKKNPINSNFKNLSCILKNQKIQKNSTLSLIKGLIQDRILLSLFDYIFDCLFMNTVFVIFTI